MWRYRCKSTCPLSVVGTTALRARMIESSFIIKMEEIFYSETAILIRDTRSWHIPENSILE
jgi:hypothetical protein